MIDFLVCVFLVLMFMLLSILEYKQKMENIEFEERIQKMRHQFEKHYRKGRNE